MAGTPEGLDDRRTGYLRQSAHVDVDGFRCLADEHGERIHRLAKLLQQRRQRGIQQGHRRFLLGDIETGGGPCPLLRLESAQYFFAVVQVLLRHLDAVAQFKRLKIRSRDAADERKRHCLLVVTAGDRRSARGTAQGAVLAPEIELVARTQFGIETIEYLRTQPRHPRTFTGCRGSQVQRRQQGGPGDACLCVGLLDAGNGSGQVIIAVLGFGDQLIEPCGPESMPPIGRRPYRRGTGSVSGSGRFMPLRRRRDFRPLVGGTHAASGQQYTEKTQAREPGGVAFHARHPGPVAIKYEWSNC